jgi:hypothetical protein
VAITTEEDFLDLGKTDFSRGDEFFFHDDLRNTGARSVMTGSMHRDLRRGEGPQGEFQCEVTFWFEQGQMATQGLAQSTGVFPHPFTSPISGGSGKYRELVVRPGLYSTRRQCDGDLPPNRLSQQS